MASSYSCSGSACWLRSHAISVIVLQARCARHSMADDPDDARHAIDAIERTGSQALAEMRRLLSILRAGEAATLAPQPSLAQLEALAGEVRGAGLPVEVKVEGEPRELSPGVDASAFRIAQEALTNVLKHAGRARAVVTVRYGSESLELEVADDGVGSTNGGGGHGLVGMRERAAVFGCCAWSHVASRTPRSQPSSSSATTRSRRTWRVSWPSSTSVIAPRR